MEFRSFFEGTKTILIRSRVEVFINSFKPISTRSSPVENVRFCGHQRFCRVGFRGVYNKFMIVESHLRVHDYCFDRATENFSLIGKRKGTNFFF